MVKLASLCGSAARLAGLPRHIGAATVTVTPLRATIVTAGLAYTGGRRDYDYLAFFRCIGRTGPCRNTTFSLNDDYLSDYPRVATVNLSAEQRVSAPLTAYVAVQDLTNEGTKRAETNFTPLPGRSVTFGLRARW